MIFFSQSGDTATCLYNTPHEDGSLPRVLPGKLLTLDAQCRRDRGTSACFVSIYIWLLIDSILSMFFELQKDDRVCAQLFCFDSGSGYCVAYRPAAEGSPCGDGQVKKNFKYTPTISKFIVRNVLLNHKTFFFVQTKQSGNLFNLLDVNDFQTKTKTLL